MDLLGADKLDDVSGGEFPYPVKISMVRFFIKAYETNEQVDFIERTIAALFREILCSCMEV